MAAERQSREEECCCRGMAAAAEVCVRFSAKSFVCVVWCVV